MIHLPDPFRLIVLQRCLMISLMMFKVIVNVLHQVLSTSTVFLDQVLSSAVLQPSILRSHHANLCLPSDALKLRLLQTWHVPVPWQ